MKAISLIAFKGTVLKMILLFRYRTVFIVLSLFLILVLPAICCSDDIFSDDEDIFMDEPAPEFQTNVKEDGQNAAQSALDQFINDATLTLGYQFAYGTDHPKKTIENNTYLRLEYQTLVQDTLFFKIDTKVFFYLKNDHIAEAKDRDVYPDLRLRELYFQKSFDSANLIVGKFINVWGKADASIVTDVLSPRDMSRFIFTDLEDARFGQWMAAVNMFKQSKRLFLFFSPRPATDLEPASGSRYDRPLDTSGDYQIKRDKPKIGDGEFGAKLDWTIASTDFSLMAGSFYLNEGLYDDLGILKAGREVLEKTYPRFSMAGAALTHAWQSFLFKLEFAAKPDFPRQGLTPDGSSYRIVKTDLVDSALGFEYNDNDKYQISVELNTRYLFSGTQDLLPGTDRQTSALYTVFTKDFFHQTLTFEYDFYHHLQEKNQFHKFSLTYDLTDDIRLKTMVTVFNIKDSESLLWPYKNEDRAEFEIQYFF